MGPRPSGRVAGRPGLARRVPILSRRSPRYSLESGDFLRDPKVMARFDPTRPDFSPYGFSCVRWTPTTMPRGDRHNEIELNLLEDGRLVYLMGGRKVVVPAGRLTVFWAGVSHQIVDFERLDRVFRADDSPGVVPPVAACRTTSRNRFCMARPSSNRTRAVWRRTGRGSSYGAKTCGSARRNAATPACWRSKPACGGWR